MAYSSMIIALVQAVSVWLQAQLIANPTLFPLGFTVTRLYDPIEDFTQIPSSTAPTNALPVIYLFPHDDPETRDGLNQAGWRGEFTVAALLIANVGQPDPQSVDPQRVALLDSLMGLRQAIREALRPQTAISLASNSSGPAVFIDISTDESYDKGALRQGIFASMQYLKFSLNSVAQ
jgi:hypothetical protein